ncbi:MAG TPA: nitroreductase/quinone reductase family protein [Acidimicrobiales bacterium]|jgi:deazaflavin-dependent oxidoreductase (nitroreductase family)|nr:nitroreductase/quinone reductase family protein [Acidimicrobiales bacterium]
MADPGPTTPSTKFQLVRFLQRYLVNPPVRALAERGHGPKSIALLETTGRRSGEARRTPVGNGQIGDTFWIVAEHGHQAAYVRNIEADPQVRVKIGHQWHRGMAHIMEDDDPLARQKSLDPTNARMVRTMGTALLTVRIDLDPEAAA